MLTDEQLKESVDSRLAKGQELDELINEVVADGVKRLESVCNGYSISFITARENAVRANEEHALITASLIFTKERQEDIVIGGAIGIWEDYFTDFDLVLVVYLLFESIWDFSAGNTKSGIECDFEKYKNEYYRLWTLNGRWDLYGVPARNDDEFGWVWVENNLLYPSCGISFREWAKRYPEQYRKLYYAAQKAGWLDMTRIKELLD